jgi:hypothetical protein
MYSDEITEDAPIQTVPAWAGRVSNNVTAAGQDLFVRILDIDGGQKAWGPCRTPLGFREDLPDYGVADIIFGDGALDTEQIHTAISMWEERADVILTESNITVDQLVRYVSVMVNSTHA